MSQKLLDAIEEIKLQIEAKEAEILTPLRLAVNQLCRVAGIPDEYPEAGLPGTAQKRNAALSWRMDQFYNRPLSQSITEVLEARKKAGMDGPASVDEIYAALCEGGFKFEGSGSDDNNRRALKISLTKNTAQFAKVKDDVFGLKKWYGMRSSTKKANGVTDKGGSETASDTGTESEPATEPEEPQEDSANPGDDVPNA